MPFLPPNQQRESTEGKVLFSAKTDEPIKVPFGRKTCAFGAMYQNPNGTGHFRRKTRLSFPRQSTNQRVARRCCKVEFSDISPRDYPAFAAERRDVTTLHCSLLATLPLVSARYPGRVRFLVLKTHTIRRVTVTLICQLISAAIF